jgi:hypothetical protein
MPGETALLRIGGVSAIVGSILFFGLVLVKPGTDWKTEPEAFLQMTAESNLWVGVHIGLIFAGLLIVGGLTGLYRSITTGASAVWAHLGFATVLVGTSVLLVFLGTYGIAFPQVAEGWVNASEVDKAAAFLVVLAVREIAQALIAVSIMVFFGVTFVLYGLAVATGTAYPRWLGWLAVVGGVGGMLAGALEDVSLSDIAFTPLFLLLLWVLVMGILMWRKAGTAQ